MIYVLLCAVKLSDWVASGLCMIIIISSCRYVCINERTLTEPNDRQYHSTELGVSYRSKATTADTIAASDATPTLREVADDMTGTEL